MKLRILLATILMLLSGCTKMQMFAHVYGDQAPAANIFHYRDGETSLFYRFDTDQAASTPETFIFFYGGFGCASWKYVMPGYVDGLGVPTRIFVLNKRFVGDRSTGMFECGEAFHLANNPGQWDRDYAEFITTQLQTSEKKPTSVVLVGVSEGAPIAIRTASHMPQVTHLVLIGDGGYSMRKVMTALHRKGDIGCDIQAAWPAIAREPLSLEKSWCGSPYRYWSDVIDFDPLPDLLKLKIPILAGMGENDRSVPVESLQFLETTFREAEKENLTVRIYPGADHTLKAGDNSFRNNFFAELGKMLSD